MDSATVTAVLFFIGVILLDVALRGGYVQPAARRPWRTIIAAMDGDIARAERARRGARR